MPFDQVPQQKQDSILAFLLHGRAQMAPCEQFPCAYLAMATDAPYSSTYALFEASLRLVRETGIPCTRTSPGFLVYLYRFHDSHPKADTYALFDRAIAARMKELVADGIS